MTQFLVYKSSQNEYKGYAQPLRHTKPRTPKVPQNKIYSTDSYENIKRLNVDDLTISYYSVPTPRHSAT